MAGRIGDDLFTPRQLHLQQRQDNCPDRALKGKWEKACTDPAAGDGWEAV